MPPIIDIVKGFRVIKHPTGLGYCVLRPGVCRSSTGSLPVYGNAGAGHSYTRYLDSDYVTFTSLEEIEKLAKIRSYPTRTQYRDQMYGVENSPIREHIQCNQS